MRRADRLFQIIQILRRARRPVTALAIAEELETSLRTIYRDITQLMADRVPIRGVRLGPRDFEWRATEPAASASRALSASPA